MATASLLLFRAHELGQCLGETEPGNIGGGRGTNHMTYDFFGMKFLSLWHAICFIHVNSGNHPL